MPPTYFCKGRSIGEFEAETLVNSEEADVFLTSFNTNVQMNHLFFKVFRNRAIGWDFRGSKERTFPTDLSSSDSEPYHHLPGMLKPEYSQISNVFVCSKLRNTERVDGHYLLTEDLWIPQTMSVSLWFQEPHFERNRRDDCLHLTYSRTRLG